MGYINRFINRHLQKKLSDSFLNNKIVTVLGARQTGKSTLIEETFTNIKKISLKTEFIKMNARTNPNSFLLTYSPPCFIDEIQRAPELFGSLQEVVDKNNFYGQYILSGSNSLKIQSRIKESLAGRSSIYQLCGLSLREILDIKFNKHFIPTKNYLLLREKEIKDYGDVWEYIHRGSYPELYDNPNKNWEEFYSSYVQTYLEKDIVEEININDKNAFMKFLSALASRTGEILNYTNIANEVEVSSNTIKSWVSLLERTNIIFLLHPFYNSHLNRAIKSPKIYFYDTGLAAYLSSWLTKDQLQIGANAGHFFETFVVNEIVKTYINEGLDFSKRLFYYRGKDKIRPIKNEKKKINNLECEIDLIIEENGTLYPIEIKKKDNPDIYDAKAFDVLKKTPNSKIGVGVIISNNKNKLYLNENVLCLPLEYI